MWGGWGGGGGLFDEVGVPYDRLVCVTDWCVRGRQRACLEHFELADLAVGAPSLSFFFSFSLWMTRCLGGGVFFSLCKWKVALLHFIDGTFFEMVGFLSSSFFRTTTELANSFL